MACISRFPTSYIFDADDPSKTIANESGVPCQPGMVPPTYQLISLAPVLAVEMLSQTGSLPVCISWAAELAEVVVKEEDDLGGPLRVIHSCWGEWMAVAIRGVGRVPFPLIMAAASATCSGLTVISD